MLGLDSRPQGKELGTTGGAMLGSRMHSEEPAGVTSGVSKPLESEQGNEHSVYPKRDFYACFEKKPELSGI